MAELSSGVIAIRYCGFYPKGCPEFLAPPPALARSPRLISMMVTNYRQMSTLSSTLLTLFLPDLLFFIKVSDLRDVS
jgi:hypothetical protein